MAGHAGPLASAQEERAPLLGVAGDSRWHRHALNGRLGSLVVVGIGRVAIEVARRPAWIANGHTLAGGYGGEIATRFRDRARRPPADAAIGGHIGRPPRAAG